MTLNVLGPGFQRSPDPIVVVIITSTLRVTSYFRLDSEKLPVHMSIVFVTSNTRIGLISVSEFKASQIIGISTQHGCVSCC